MLFNLSHQITNSGLPQHIQDRYVRYKQGNRAIVAWMTRYGPERYKGRKLLPIKQLIALGRFLCDNIQEVGTLPADVDYYFKEVIQERTYLSRYFRHNRDQCEKDDMSTVNHEHFTESLRRIYEILLTVGKPQSVSRKSVNSPNTKTNRSKESFESENPNAFALLCLTELQEQHLAVDDSDSESSRTDTDATSQCSHDVTLPDSGCECEVGGSGIDFLDENSSLSIAFQAGIIMNIVQQVSCNLDECWKAAGRGETSLAAATGYTNILLTYSSDSIRSSCGIEADVPSPSAMQHAFSSFKSPERESGFALNPQTKHTLEALVDTEKCLRASVREVIDTSNYHEALKMSDGLSEDLVQDLFQLLTIRCSSCLTTEGWSYLSELWKLHTHMLSNITMLLISVYIHLTSQCHTSYCSALVKQSHIAVPRITALKLANEAISSIEMFINDKSIFPCQCVNTLGFRIAQMRVDLDSFVRFRCWNSLIQTPQVAGNHVLEILDLCSYYGLHLIHYRHYVAAVLHTYQALIRLSYIDECPVLEGLCNTLAVVLWPNAARAESGFMASWLRYIGARLRFRKGKKNLDHKDTWCMAVPAHAAARSAGLNIDAKGKHSTVQPKFDYGTIDLMTRLKHNGWVLPMDTIFKTPLEVSTTPLNRSYENSAINVAEHAFQNSILFRESDTRTRHKRSQSCHTDNSSDTSGIDDGCKKFNHALDVCFQTDSTQDRNMPTGRLNLLSTFHSMAKVVSGISDATHATDTVSKVIQDSSNEVDGKGQMCLCFVQTILRGADRIQGVRKTAGVNAKGAIWTPHEKECIECYRTQLLKMLGAASKNGNGSIWLWSSI